MAAWAFAPLRRYGYGAVLIDPPWLWKTWSAAGQGKSPGRHYPYMSDAAIAALPVAELLRADGWCVLWATAPRAAFALDCGRSWGLEFVTMGGWAKRARDGAQRMGPGHVRRSVLEPYFIFRAGRPAVLSGARRTTNLIDAERREHSRKPDRMIAEIEASFPGPYAEIFARTQRPGWDVWGNETGKFG